LSSEIVKKIENIEIFSIGDLVSPEKGFDAIYGTSPEIWQPWKIGGTRQTITAADNIAIYPTTLGIIVGYVGQYHTVMYIVMWLNICGKDSVDLVVPYNKIRKRED
jgi:hypothetical protein